MANILLIDDDEKLCKLVKDFLEANNHTVNYYTAASRGLEALKINMPDLLLLDVMMPDQNGFEVLKQVRQKSRDLAVIMLTARGEPMDRVLGLELGADDYIPKPYEPRELLARINGVLRRSNSTSSAVSSEKLVLDENKYLATLEGVNLDLTTAEFEILYTLMKNKPDIVSRDVLIEKLHGSEWAAFDRGVDVLISRLRAKLKDDPKEPSFIKTIRSKGYKFIG
jgi:DNA-binding response OmpR family regulator